MREQAASPPLWFGLFVKDFDLSPADVAVLRDNPRAAYAARIKGRKDRLRTVANRKREERVAKRARCAQEAFGLALTVYNILVWVTSPFPSLLAFFILLALKLDGEGPSSWQVVFTPVWVWLLAALPTLLFGCYLHWRERGSGPPFRRIPSCWGSTAP
jgi:hypothetical protein